MKDERWIELTVVGSAYQEQMEVQTNRWRHRPLNFAVIHSRGISNEDIGIGDWIDGPAPEPNKPGKGCTDG